MKNIQMFIYNKMDFKKPDIFISENEQATDTIWMNLKLKIYTF